MHAFLSDIRFSLRTFRKSPGFVLAAVLALAFGIGVNSAVFTLLNAIALRPIPVRDAGRVVTVYQLLGGKIERNTHGSRGYVSTAEYAAYRDGSHTFSGLAAQAPTQLTLSGTHARPLVGHLVSCNYFAVLAPPLPLGRTFGKEECEQRPASVVVIGDRLWKDQFHSDPQILGRSITLNRTSYTVIGVAPPNFTGANIMAAEAWAPLTAQEQWIPDRQFYDDTNVSWLELVGRLQPGVAVSQARADLAIVAANLDRQAPGRKTQLLVDRATLMNDPEGRMPVLGVGAVLLAAVSLVLIIACANLANLLLARALGRQKEIAVRMAVGASRGRLLRQLLTESLMLSAAASVLGVMAAWMTLRTLIPFLLLKLPAELHAIALNPSPDIRILLYSVALAVATGVGFGLAPALQTTRFDLNSALKESGAASTAKAGWLRSSLVGAQIAVCLVLLVAAGLLLRGLQAAQSIDPGFDTAGIFTAGFDLTNQGYNQARAAAFQEQLAGRLAARPGIEAVAFGDPLPLSGSRNSMSATAEGVPGSTEVTNATVSANYFHLMGIPIVRGRAFEPRESTSEDHVVVLTEATARRFWPGQDPIGKHIRMLDQKYELEVIGVAKDIHASGLAEKDKAFAYMGIGPLSHLDLDMVVRGSGNVAQAIREETRAIDANILLTPGTMAENVSLFQLPSRILSSLALTLGLAGLVLAAMGIYAVMAYLVTQRGKEIGIRMALGAQPSDVIRLVLAQAMRPVAIGMIVGIAASVALSRVLGSMLYGVSARDPAVFLGVTAFLGAAALLAGFIPARRASVAHTLMRFE